MAMSDARKTEKKMEFLDSNLPGEDPNSSNGKKSLKIEPNLSRNNLNISVIDSPQVEDFITSHPDLIKKLKYSLRGREFITVDKDFNSKIFNYEHDPTKFLIDKHLTIINHDFDIQSWLRANVEEWKTLIGSLQRRFLCAIFSGEDFSNTYVCNKKAESESILSEVLKFFDQSPSDVKISPYVMEFIRHNKEFSDLKLGEMAQNEIWIQSLEKPRLDKLKEEIRKFVCQSYLLDENQYKLLCDKDVKILSHVEENFQVKGNIFAAGIPLAIEVNPQTSISCIVGDESGSFPVDKLIILDKQNPSQEFNLVFDRHCHKVWETFPSNLPTNQVVYAELSPTFKEDKMNGLFEECLRTIYLNSLPVTVLGIQPCFQSTINWKKFFSSLVSTVELLQREQVKIPCHYIMIIADNDKILAQIMKIFENEMTVTKGQGELNITVIEGDLSEQNVDIIVNSTNKMLCLQYGELSKSLAQKAGPELQRECNRACAKGIYNSNYVVTKGYNLPCTYVFHGVLPPSQKSAISAFVSLCLEKSALLKVSTIALPVLGTGILKYPPEIAVKEMNEGFKIFSMKHPIHNIKEVRIVVFPGKLNTQIIKETLSKTMTTASADISPSPSSIPEEKGLKNCQRKLLCWILFVNYSGEPKNLESGLRNFQMGLNKVPYEIQSDDLEDLIFFTDIFSLIPDIIIQYSEMRDRKVQLYLPPKNFTQLKNLQKDITDKLEHLSLKVNVKLNKKQVEILLLKIQQKYPQMRCQVTDNGQTFHFRSLDSSMNQRAKYQLESFLGSGENVSVTSERFNKIKPEPERTGAEPKTELSSYDEQEKIRPETSALLKPRKTNPEPKTILSYPIPSQRIKSSVSYSQKNDDANCFKIKDGPFIKVYQGDILNISVDGIVIAVDISCDQVSKAIIKSAGDSVNRELQAKLRGRWNEGEVFSTSAGNLKQYKNIIHAPEPVYLPGKSNEYSMKIDKIVHNSLIEATRIGLCSVALPAIGSAKFEVPLDICTNAYFVGVEEFCKSKTPNSQLNEIHFVDLNPDKCQAIKYYFAKQMNEAKINWKIIQQPNDRSPNLPSRGKTAHLEDTCFDCKKPLDVVMMHNICRHNFCAHCIEKPCIPCRIPSDIVCRNHRGGTMFFKELSWLNYKKVYQIEYHIPISIQKDNPEIDGTTPITYLPGTEEGETILKMVQLAFERNIIIKVEDEIREYVSFSGIPFRDLKLDGYWDPKYLNKIKDLLAAQGITPENVAGRELRNQINLK